MKVFPVARYFFQNFGSLFVGISFDKANISMGVISSYPLFQSMYFIDVFFAKDIAIKLIWEFKNNQR